jgi:hypothetical protein
MTCLSIVEGNLPPPPRVVANPVFVISPIQECRNGTELIFEVFEADAEALKRLVGAPQLYVFNSTSAWGKLKSLDPCESTHPGLAYLRNKPTLRGVLVFFEEASSRQ